MTSLGEFGSIARYLAPLAAKGGAALSLKDDAAVWTPPPGQSLVFTKDAMVAGVHFLVTDPPALVARKLARVNLSDLAAMGAEPLGYLLALVLPRGAEESWMAGFAEGLAREQEIFGWDLWGGDTVATDGPAVVTLTAIGAVPPGLQLTRSGARPGDHLFVSGTLGDAALGLLARQGKLAGLDAGQADYLEQRFLLPTPRIELGLRLRGLASAAMDVSDGVAADLGHLARASGVGARLDPAALPLSPAAQGVLDREPELRDRIFAGDDYELLFTAPEKALDDLQAIARDLNLPLTRIGEIETGSGVHALDGGPLPGGYRHF